MNAGVMEEQLAACKDGKDGMKTWGTMRVSSNDNRGAGGAGNAGVLEARTTK